MQLHTTGPILEIPKIKHKTFAVRSFKYAAPKTWNSFPKQIGTCKPLSSLNHYLITICTKKQSTLNKPYIPNYLSYNPKFL